MTPFMSLLLPIVVAAVAAIQSLNLAPDDYAVPNPQLPGGAKNPNFIADFERGPTFHMTVIPSGGCTWGSTWARGSGSCCSSRASRGG